MDLDVLDFGRSAVVLMEGEFTRETEGKVRGTLWDLFEQERSPIVLNMAKVCFWDNSAAGLVAACRRRVSEYGGEVILCALTRPVRKYVDLLEFDKFFRVIDCETEVMG